VSISRRNLLLAKKAAMRMQAVVATVTKLLLLNLGKIN